MAIWLLNFSLITRRHVNVLDVSSETSVFFVILINFPSCWADGKGAVTQSPDPLWRSYQVVTILLPTLLAWFTCMLPWKQVTLESIINSLVHSWLFLIHKIKEEKNLTLKDVLINLKNLYKCTILLEIYKKVILYFTQTL